MNPSPARGARLARCNVMTSNRERFLGQFRGQGRRRGVLSNDGNLGAFLPTGGALGGGAGTNLPSRRMGMGQQDRTAVLKRDTAGARARLGSAHEFEIGRAHV